MSDSIVSAIMAFLFALATLLPLHERPLNSFYNDWLATVAVIVAFILIARTRGAAMRIPIATIFPFALLLIILAQGAAGLVPSITQALIPAAYLLMAMIAMVVGATLSSRLEGREALCVAIAWGTLGAALVSVFLAFGQLYGLDLPFIFYPDGAQPINRPYANLGQPNHLALLLCFGLASVAYLYRKMRLPAGMALICMLLLLCGLTLAQSRTGVVLLVAYFFLLAWYERQRGNTPPIPFVLLACAMLLFAAMQYALPPLLELLQSSNATGGQGGSSRLLSDGSVSTRMVYLQQAWEMIKLHPWTGVGWGQFAVHQFDLTTAFPLVEKSNHSHNLAANLVAELGVPIGALAGLLLLGWLFSLLQTARHSAETGFVFLVVAGAAIHSMFEFPLWYAYFLLPVAVLAGTVQERSAQYRWSVSGMSAMLLGLVAAAGLYWTQHDYQVLRIESSSLQSEVRVGRISPDTNRPAFTLFPHFHDFISFVRTPAQSGLSSAELAQAANTVSRFAAPAAIERLATMYVLNDRDGDAVRTATILRKTHPCNYTALYNTWLRNAAIMPAQWGRRAGLLPAPLAGQC